MNVGKRMKCRGCNQWEFVRGFAMNNFLQDDKGKWRCYDCLYDKPNHKVVVIGRGKHKPFVAETFGAYDDSISERQEWLIGELGGKVDKSMNRSKASDYIKELQGKKSGTWKDAETFECNRNLGLDRKGLDSLDNLTKPQKKMPLDIRTYRLPKERGM